MGVKFGEIQSEQILENEFRIGVLEGILEWVVNNNTALNKPNTANIRTIKEETIATLKLKYPKSKIELK